MARPVKNSCDYFPHDADMRNHRKIKAVRNKFGIEGYAIWTMYLEYLTASDGNQAEYNETEFELLSGDFGSSGEAIKQVIDYCIQLKLLKNENSYISSESLDERLEPVYLKRGRMRDLALSRQANRNKPPAPPPAPPPQNEKKKEVKAEVIDATTEINIDFDFFWSEYDKKVGDKTKLKAKWNKLTDKERELAMNYIPEYKAAQPDKSYRKNPETFLNNKSWNDELIFRTQNERKQKLTVDQKFANANTIIDEMFSGAKRY
jgi:hypothetical protein